MSMKQVTIRLTNWITGSIIFEYACENNSIKKTLEEAVSRGADLRYSNLCGADLCGADLCGADLRCADLRYSDLRYSNLRGANLYGAKNIPDDSTDYWWHVHHGTLVEQLTEPVRARINYIKAEKPKDEIALRLRLLHPVLGKIPTTAKGWERLHRVECKDCTWNGRTIFPEKEEAVA